MYTSRPPTYRFEAAAPSGYRHLLLRPSPIAAGLSRVHAEDKPVQERFIVGGPVHRDDPTLSATEAIIQWYGEPSLLGTSLAAVDGHNFCRTLLCPLRPTPLAVAAFMTIGTKSFSFAHSAGSSLRMLPPRWPSGKASASRAEGPGFESRLRRDFSGSSHTSDLNIGTPVATLPGAWRYRVSAGTGRPGVSIL